MEIIDYNGEGRWSATEIRSRYEQFAAEAGIVPRDVSPQEHTDGRRRWVYPVMEEVIAGIKEGDPACVRIGIEFIEEDRSFRFGRILKANTARALRRARLSEGQKLRIVRRIFEMLRRGYIPREFRDYAKLARQIGFSASEVPRCDATNAHVRRYYEYFIAAASTGR